MESIKTTKTVLITGTTGYIGKILHQNLSKKYSVFCLNRTASNEENFTWDNFPQKQIDVIIHLAGKAHDTTKGIYEDYHQANVLLTEKVINYCNQTNVEHLIFISTSKVYCNNDNIIDEKSSVEGSSFYQKTKIKAENLIKTHLRNTTYHILQPPIVIGKLKKGNMHILKSLFSKIPIWPLGAFTNVKSIISYDNLEFFISELIEKKPKSNTFLVCDDLTLSTTDLIKLQFPKVRVINSGKKIWIILAKVGSFLNLNIYNLDVLNKIIQNEIYSNEKIKKELDITKTKHDVNSR